MGCKRLGRYRGLLLLFTALGPMIAGCVDMRDLDGDMFTPEEGDCDDSAPGIFPGATEMPHDGIDSNCNGNADEDLDGDGYSTDGTIGGQADCNDASVYEYPGRPEFLDGIDNDCNGLVDDHTDQADDDGDGLSEAQGDCSDGDPTIYPFAPELVNGIDDDCDGVIDDGTVVFDDDGDGMTEEEGDCNDADPSVYRDAVELPDNKDNDCDGIVDDETSKWDDDGDGYSEDQGDCNDADWTVHPNAIDEGDGLDNDCDGLIDEGNPSFDDDGDGVTEDAGDCDDANPAVYPGAIEVFDGIDNDCNGLTDEGNPNYDDDGDGVTENAGDCNDANPAVYQGADETCNGVDDDCDGTVDNGDPEGGLSCLVPFALGACAVGVLHCVSGAVACVSTISGTPANQVAELSCNGVDDDCDGTVDEGCSCITGLTAPCGTNAGICVAGVQTCGPTGQWGATCAGSVGPVIESCNGVDDDCDGIADNGNPDGGGACATGLPGQCQQGTLQCSGGALHCAATLAPVSEVCNGLDDDCDGTVDENNPGGGATCSTGLGGTCQQGTLQCAGGALVCVGLQLPQAEVCNGIDDDCNGLVDEGLLNACGTCGAAPTEVCNAMDDDCDGLIDEGLQNCGLTYSCSPFGFSTHGSTGVIPVVSPGSTTIPIVEVEHFGVTPPEDDGTWGFDVVPGGFKWGTKYGSGGEQLWGRVCLLGVGARVEGAASVGMFPNGPSTTISVGVPANPFEVTDLSMSFIWSYNSGTDNNFQYVSAQAPGSLTILPTSGNGNSSIEASIARLSLPAGYTVVQTPFKVFDGNSAILDFVDDPALGVNLLFANIITYDACGGFYFSYDATCGATSCTVSAWNGNPCSYVEGYITQLQWVDNI